MRASRSVFSPVKWFLSLVCIVVAADAFAALAWAASYTSIDVPGGGDTYATDINQGGTIAGGYGPVDHRHGFVRTADGTFTLFDPEGSVYTAAVAINNRGLVTGFYEDANEINHAFIRHPNGRLDIINYQGSSTEAEGINRQGDICGLYHDHGGGGQLHGLVRTADGTLTAFDPPGSIFTEPRSINDSGAITGMFEDGAYHIHGFVRAPDGAITVLDLPGSFYTEGFAINAKGSVIGAYADAAGGHFFIRNAKGHYTSVDPGHQPTSPFGAIINAKDEIAGAYKQGPHSLRTFQKKPDSQIRHLHVPLAIRFASPFGINNKGEVVGTIEDSNGAYHGFLRTP